MTLTTSLHKKLTFILSLAVSAFLFIVLTQTSHAATINVVAGTDAIDANGQCQLSEAIQNINDQATTNADCAAGDGNDDTINLPAGTITLSGDTPKIRNTAIVQGQGQAVSVIDGEGQYRINEILMDLSESITIRGVSISGFNGVGITAMGTNITIENVEIDGANASHSSVPAVGGILAVGENVTISDVYIHDLSADGVNSVAGISAHILNGYTSSVSIQKVSIANISSADSIVFGISFVTGMLDGSLTPGTMNASVSDTSITNLASDTNSATAFSALSAVNNGTSLVDLVLSNNTITAISGAESFLGATANIATGVAALGPSDEATVNITGKNIIAVGDASSCIIAGDLAAVLGAGSSAGAITNTISSSGGNISDDASCNDYFTEPTDQNNVDPADLQLGTLGDYGGSVPTIPLGQGSIAIDAGVTVPGLTTDARGVSRPQCRAYDSGAYEYNGTCPTPPSSQPLTGTTSNSTPISLVLPGSATNASLIPIASNTIPTDPSFTYPSGLTSFQFDTEQGATETITLYFDLPGDPQDYTARKYNTTTKAFTTIQGATITRETYNNQSMLKLTYQITDGGDLDQDNTTNGTIVDPVGLAQTKTTAPDTGLGKYWLLNVNKIEL